MTIDEFEKRADYNGGYDRAFGIWRLLDVHQVPEVILAQYEFDFYCFNGQEIYLLRLRKRNITKYEKLKTERITYLIAELEFDTIDDNLIGKVLSQF